MENIMKRILTLAIAVIMLFSSCNSKDENSQNTQTNESESNSQMPVTSDLITESDVITTTPDESGVITFPEFTTAAELLDVDVECTYAAVLDVETNQYIYKKGRIAKTMYPASTTKILTAIVALSICDLDVKHTVGDELDFVKADSSVADIPRNRTFDLDSLLKAMMLPSGNDAAYAVAACAGKYLSDDDTVTNKEAVSLFIDEMNRFADEVIGTKGTHFTCPDGYPDDEHFTTTDDMMRIARYAIEVPEIMEIVSTVSCTITSIPETEGEDTVSISLTNTNRLLKRGDYFYKYAKGMKTGTTRAAGNCLISYAEKDGRRVICCVFQSPTGESRYTDSRSLLVAALGE